MWWWIVMSLLNLKCGADTQVTGIIPMEVTRPKLNAWQSYQNLHRQTADMI
jgi:hypothetical protein